MLQALGRIGTRVALATGLTVLVVAIVMVSRLGGGANSTNRYDAGPEPSVVAVDPTAGDDSEVLPTPGDADNEAIERAAIEFASAWMRRDLSVGAWHTSLSQLSTATLAASLDGVDPRSVPAARIVGVPRLVLRAARYAQVSIEVDSGSLLLSLLNEDGRWLVDGVDWERA